MDLSVDSLTISHLGFGARSLVLNGKSKEYICVSLTQLSA
jgi:hypothetical protein